MDWKEEFNKMLATFEREALLSLGNIKKAFKRNGLTFNPKFKRYFLQALTARLEQTYNQFEFNSQLEEETFGRASASGSGSAATLSRVKSEANDLIEIDDSSDDEGANDGANNRTPEVISSMGSLNANSLGKSRFKQSKQSGASTMGFNDCNEFRIGSTMIRGCQSIATNEKVTNDEEAFVGPDTDASDESTQQSHGCAAANSVQKSSVVDVGRRNGTMLDKNSKRSVNMEIRRAANMSKKVQTNSNTRSAHTRPISSKTIATVAPNSSQHVVGSLKTNRFKCQICGYVGLHVGHLSQHMRKHTGERPYRCDRCGKGFSQPITLKMHATTHTDIYPFHCKGCFRQFLQKTEKEAHEKECTVRRYECHLCKKFVRSNKTQLKRHMRKHTGEKPFRCEICMARFTRKWDLNRHLNNVHGKTH